LFIKPISPNYEQQDKFGGIILMTDIVDSKTRSKMMSNIKNKNTKPEIIVRKFLHSKGLRFRLHSKDLPGKPDLVFHSRKVVVFVHGCFWHRHQGCPKSTTPSSNSSFWKKKFEENIARDKRVSKKLEKLGWTVLIIWECQINKTGLENLLSQIKKVGIKNK
jgi:DNA mismatch endonuclease (patch repair protein)